MNWRTVLGTALLGLVLVTLGALIAAPALLPERARLDPDTLCPAERPPVAHTAIVVDRTDPLAPHHLDRLRRAVARTRADLPVHGRLTVHRLTADPAAVTRPLFDMCHPGDGADADPLTANPRRLRQRYETRFQQPLAAVVAGFETARGAPRSPILESLAAFARATGGTPAPRRIVLVSDLLQNTGSLSHYRNRPDVATALTSTIGRRLAAEGLADTVVELVYLRRGARRQGSDHLRTWIDLLERVGAEVRIRDAASRPGDG